MKDLDELWDWKKQELLQKEDAVKFSILPSKSLSTPLSSKNPRRVLRVHVDIDRSVWQELNELKYSQGFRYLSQLLRFLIENFKKQ